MNVAFQSTYLATNGGYVHVRITKDRQLENGPLIPVCIETTVQPTQDEPTSQDWVFNLGGILAVLDLAIDQEAILGEMRPFAKWFREELISTISKTEAANIPEAIQYGDVTATQHDSDTIILSTPQGSLALHVLTLLTFTHGLTKEKDILDEQLWDISPSVWKTNTFTDADLDVPEALDSDFVLTDSAEFRLQKEQHLVTILPAGDLPTEKTQITLRIEHLLHMSYAMLQPMYQYKLLDSMREYLRELEERFGWTSL